MIPKDVQVTITKEPDQKTVSSFIALIMRDKRFIKTRIMKYLRKVNIICIEMKYASIYGFEMSKCYVVAILIKLMCT